MIGKTNILTILRRSYLLNKAKIRTMPRWLVLIIPTMMFAISVAAQSTKEDRQNNGAQNIFELLSEDEVLEITIIVDLDSIISTKNLDDYHSAIIQKKSNNHQRSGWKVKVRARGKHRRKICDIPPLKINFNKSEFKSENLESHKSLKLVTHCNDNEDAEELILKEYLAYKIYNIITDQSLRVQLTKVEWVDMNGEHDIGMKWGFLIENEIEMSQRIGGQFIDTFAVDGHHVCAKSGARSSLFQYMIGNPDWGISPCKNMSIIRPESSGAFLTIPYDFDFSGFVDAPYAVSDYGLKSVKERIYLGDSKAKDLEEAKDLFRSKKKTIYEEVRSFDLLSRSSKKEVLDYLKSFYSEIDAPLKGKDFYEKRLTKRK